MSSIWNWCQTFRSHTIYQHGTKEIHIYKLGNTGAYFNILLLHTELVNTETEIILCIYYLDAKLLGNK